MNKAGFINFLSGVINRYSKSIVEKIE